MTREQLAELWTNTVHTVVDGAEDDVEQFASVTFELIGEAGDEAQVQQHIVAQLGLLAQMQTTSLAQGAERFLAGAASILFGAFMARLIP